MSITDLVMPDPLTLARERLLEVDEVTGEVEERITDRTGDPLPELPFVRLDLIGGPPSAVPERLDHARIQVHVFGGQHTEPATLALAQIVRAALVATRSWVGTTGVITGTDVSGPIVLPDPTHSPPLVDVTFTVSLYTHP